LPLSRGASAIASASAIAAGALPFPDCSAIRTTTRLIDEALAVEEILLRGAEYEIIPAIRAPKGFVFVVHG